MKADNNPVTSNSRPCPTIFDIGVGLKDLDVTPNPNCECFVCQLWHRKEISMWQEDAKLQSAAEDLERAAFMINHMLHLMKRVDFEDQRDLNWLTHNVVELFEKLPVYTQTSLACLLRRLPDTEAADSEFVDPAMN